MSARRAERRRHQIEAKRARHAHHIDNASDYGMVAGWAGDVGDLDEARREGHDILVRLMGSARTGAVKWSCTQGTAAFEQLDLLEDRDSEGGVLDIYRRIRRLLIDHGGWLVIAMAPGRMPASPEIPRGRA